MNNITQKQQKRAILLILILTIVIFIICLSLALTFCTKNNIVKIDEWTITTNYVITYTVYLLELKVKTPLRIIDYTVINSDFINEGDEARIGLSHIPLDNGFYSKGDKIRFEVTFPLNKIPKKTEITVEYKNGKTDKFMYIFLR